MYILFLLIYDIEAIKDPHGIRIRLVRALRKGGAFQIQRSVWLIEEIKSELLRIIDEFRRAGGEVKISEWLPRSIGEVAKDTIRLKKALVAVNGAEPFVSKWHLRLCEVLEKAGYSVEVRPASESAAEEYEVLTGKRVDCISKAKTISRVLDEMALDDLDALVILNFGRSSQSGIMFIAQTISNTKVLKNMGNIPVVHVESPGCHDSGVIVWSEAGRALGKRISEELSVPLIVPSVEVKRVIVNGGREIRQIQYANPGDTIILDGKPVGECISDKVYIVAEGGRIVDIMGGRMFRKNSKSVKFRSLAETIIKTIPKKID
ncbi:MAG: DUF2117 domain-containing protein [Candidatus Verstraetearchaeota archaeon]|nr:DUF2117 domain-containing protein [Candidatus Verstraetearchaeota archaeon]